MGVYSTVTISRSMAIDQIIHLLATATNNELSQALFALTCDHTLDNYGVLNDSEYDQLQTQETDL